MNVILDSRLPSQGSYPQDMKGKYVRIMAWQKPYDGPLPDHAVAVMLAMIRGRYPDATESHVEGMVNKTFTIVGRGSRFGGEILAVYRHDDYWQVIAFGWDDWLDQYGMRRDIAIDRDELPSYTT